jgi:hypothetical protein
MSKMSKKSKTIQMTKLSKTSKAIKVSKTRSMCGQLG